MKFSKLLILLAILLFGPSAQSQTSRADTVKMLCQNWKFKSISHEPLSKELLEDWNEWKNNVRYNFFVNNTFKEIWGSEIESGKWEYDSNKKIIIFKREDNDFWFLKSISSSRLEVEFLTILDPEKMVNAILIPAKN